jgi:hypothetical protein
LCSNMLLSTGEFLGERSGHQNSSLYRTIRLASPAVLLCNIVCHQLFPTTGIGLSLC